LKMANCLADNRDRARNSHSRTERNATCGIRYQDAQAGPRHAGGNDIQAGGAYCGLGAQERYAWCEPPPYWRFFVRLSGGPRDRSVCRDGAEAES
jgi:hypothetical protein